MFDNTAFTSVTSTARTTLGNAPISVTHAITGNGKNEQLYRLTKETLDKCNMSYQDKVEILYDPTQTVCRIQKVTAGVTLSQQVKSNPNAAAIIRLTYRKNIHPDLLTRARKILGDDALQKARYEHKENRIEYKDGCLTFELELAE